MPDPVRDAYIRRLSNAVQAAFSENDQEAFAAVLTLKGATSEEKDEAMILLLKDGEFEREAAKEAFAEARQSFVKYIGVMEAEIREWESLAAWANDPTDARRHLDVARTKLERLKSYVKA